MSITSPSNLQRTIDESSGRGIAEIILFFSEQGNVYMKGEKKTYVIGTTTENNESAKEIITLADSMITPIELNEHFIRGYLSRGGEMMKTLSRIRNDLNDRTRDRGLWLGTNGDY